jgi:hypothetical protein
MIIDDSTFWLSLASLFLVCALSSLKVIYKFKCSDITCGCVKIHRDTYIESIIDTQRRTDDIPPNSNDSLRSDSNL